MKKINDDNLLIENLFVDEIEEEVILITEANTNLVFGYIRNPKYTGVCSQAESTQLVIKKIIKYKKNIDVINNQN